MLVCSVKITVLDIEKLVRMIPIFSLQNLLAVKEDSVFRVGLEKER
jgi:hypothetical protein